MNGKGVLEKQTISNNDNQKFLLIPKACNQLKHDIFLHKWSGKKMLFGKLTF